MKIGYQEQDESEAFFVPYSWEVIHAHTAADLSWQGPRVAVFSLPKERGGSDPNAACEAAEPDPRQCFFAQVISKYVRSPVFALQSVVDNHQVRRMGASAFTSVVASEVRNTVLVFLDQLCVEIGRENGAEMTTSLSNLVSIWGSGLPRLLLQ